QGEYTAWKRRLAASLVGLIPTTRENETCDGRRLSAWCQQAAASKQFPDSEIAAIKAADDKAHAAAARLLAALGKQDWGTAIPSYEEADKSIDALIQAAQTACANAFKA